ncbi:MAG: zinc-binding dehydrogenase [Terricaulis sp.]
MSMRAAVMRGDRFVVEERPAPKPGPGDVLVKVRACGICGSDLHYFKHAPEIIDMAAKLGASTDEMRRTLREGPVLGHEFVCEVVAFGPETQQTMKVGDRVASMPFVLKDGAPVLVGSSPEVGGAYAEYMLLSEALLLPVPEAVADDAAALIEPLGIAVHAVNKAKLDGDETAVVVGCGPIGLTVIAVLKARGVANIIAADLSPKRRALAEKMGATQIIDGRAQSAVTAAGAGKVVVFENTGAPGMFGRILNEAPQNTKVVVTGIAAGEESFLPMIAIMKEISVAFVIYYTAEEFAEALSLIERDALDWRALVTGEVGLEEVTQAFADLSDPERHAKILIKPWANT